MNKAYRFVDVEERCLPVGTIGYWMGATQEYSAAAGDLVYFVTLLIPGNGTVKLSADELAELTVIVA